MAQAQDMLRIRSDVRPIVSKGMGTQEQLGDQSSSYYASGKHFVGNDGFIYEATKDIQVGDTISVGTLATDNCIKTDLCTVIDALDGNIPTKTSDLTNDSGFITTTVNNLVNYYLKTETYSKTEVDAIATAIKNSRFEVVASLPTTDIKTNVIYLVPTSSSITSNVKDEYINLDGTSSGWELIGSTSVDLSGYVTTTQLNTALADYVTSTNLTTILAGYVQSSALATVATSGSYNDLSGKPTLGTAAAKNSTNAVTEDSTDLVESGAVYDEISALNEALANKAYQTDDTAETDIADGDYFPFFDVSAESGTGAKRKTLWSNIKSALSNLFARRNDLTDLNFAGQAPRRIENEEFFYCDGMLRKATKTINSGDSITNNNSKAITKLPSNSALGCLNEILSVSKPTLTFNGADTGFQYSFGKCGKICVLTFYGKFTTSGNQTVVNIPDGYRPAQTITFITTSEAGDSITSAVQTGGNVIVYGVKQNKMHLANITWITA